jgi:Fe-S cluster assembly ATP-binding protein
MSAVETITLYRPTGAKELALIRESGFTAFPPRLPEQPIFYPVTNEAYATQIARDWNTRFGAGVGYVTRFEVEADYLARYDKRVVGSSVHEEYWIPAEELEAFNRHIVGKIEVIMLEIKNLHVTVEDKEILKGIDLTIMPGEVHAIMGPNGSGKSTLAYIMTGREGYEVTKGEVLYQGRDLLDMEPEERAASGVFLAFQYPVEIPGVANTTFLKEAVNAQRRHRGESELDAMQFLKLVRRKVKELGIADEMLKRAVNVGFSGGEKKRNEMLQMALLEPRLAVLDETDSGLDIDALKAVADGVNALRAPDRAMLVITHYQRLLNYIVPDRVHVLAQGRIQRSGGKELAHELEQKGYSEFAPEAA